MNGARCVSILLFAAGLTIGAPAFAGDPTAADSETALQLYKDGKAARESGDLQGALTKLRAAHALVQTPITATELGRTYVALGQLLEAREVLLTVSRMAARANESAKSQEARVEAEALAAELRPRLATLTVRPKGASATPRISVDGVAVPPEAATVARLLNPGAHVVVLEANGQRVQTDVTLSEGQSRDVEIDVPAAAPPQSVVPPPSTSPAETGAWKPNRLVYIGFGTAIVGIGVGTVTGILTLSKASTLKESCPNGRCPASSQSDIDSTSTTGAISTAFFLVGAVGLGIGVVGLATSGRSTETPRTGLRIVPTGNGIAGSF